MNIEWLYLDMNIYNRPFDDQRQARVRLETLACQMMFELIQQGRFILLAQRFSGVRRSSRAMIASLKKPAC